MGVGGRGSEPSEGGLPSRSISQETLQETWEGSETL